MKEEIKIEPISDIEAESLPKMCEIRFDCLVRMFDMGIEKPNSLVPFKVKREIPRKPQWFKSSAKMTLEHIKYADEYEIGRMVKDMYRQLEIHIRQFEEHGFHKDLG